MRLPHIAPEKVDGAQTILGPVRVGRAIGADPGREAVAVETVLVHMILTRVEGRGGLREGEGGATGSSERGGDSNVSKTGEGDEES